MKYYLFHLLISALAVISTVSCSDDDKITNGIVGPVKEVTLNGQVTCNGSPVEGVTVSDGVEVVRTDSEGKYSLVSQKKYGYVFISVPGGYMCETEGSKPLFWQKIKGTASTEEHSFRLTEEENTVHRLIVSADYHLADRYGSQDLHTFEQTFMEDIRNLASSDIRTYGIALGDMTWDIYWDQYSMSDYGMQAKEFPMPTFNVIGNHDYDMSKTDDFKAEQVYRSNLGPTFYSFNLGKCHYVVLDDIVYINKGQSREHDTYVSQEQLDWLMKDLENIPHNTPVFICMHCAAFDISGVSDTGGIIKVGLNFSKATMERKLADCLKDYTEVHILTGDTHINQSIPPASMSSAYSNMYEHNIAAVCASWWWTTYMSGNSICKDGSEGGYMVFDNNATDIRWRYKTMKYDFDKQFRCYDFNTIRQYLDTDIMVPVFFDKYSSRERYSSFSENTVFINVWNWDPDWTVKVTENRVELPVTQHYIEDPLHTVSYDIPRTYTNGELTSSFRTIKTHHMFSVQASSADTSLEITVTDPFGNVSKEIMSRPKAFNADIN